MNADGRKFTNFVQRWKGGRYGHGQVLLVEDLLLVQTEEGVGDTASTRR